MAVIDRIAASTGFIEFGWHQYRKAGQHLPGDICHSQKIDGEQRVITVLADGLGSGVKANVLATLTATMAGKYTLNFADPRQSAQTILDTLPVCKVRQISYSTFTIIDAEIDGKVRVTEHENPPFVLLRNGIAQAVDKTEDTFEKWGERQLFFSEFDMSLGDRLVFFSDGVCQAGLGRFDMPVGWKQQQIVHFLEDEVASRPDISASRLARRLVNKAREFDDYQPKDDMTCGVMYYRHPRRLLVVTGPPFDADHDLELAELVQQAPGAVAICGGTTAQIVARQLDVPLEVAIQGSDQDVPPASRMEGVDLVTEGIITLGTLAKWLEDREPVSQLPANPARDLLDLMLNSDVIRFVVGTRINEAHQDPQLPESLELRRNVIRRIAKALADQHLKQTEVEFI